MAIVKFVFRIKTPVVSEPGKEMVRSPHKARRAAIAFVRTEKNKYFIDVVTYQYGNGL